MFYKKHSRFNFFIKSSAVFFLLVIVGTLLHECGHILPAKLLGFTTKLHYDSMTWSKNGIDGEHFSVTYRFIIILSGVLQTILTGTFGFFLATKYKGKIFWIGTYLTFFWSREIANLLMQIGNGLLNDSAMFTGNGDEVLLSKILGLPTGFFSILLGCIGFFLCTYIVFEKMPKNYRLPFILSGVFGTSLGTFVWFFKIGMHILP